MADSLHRLHLDAEECRIVRLALLLYADNVFRLDVSRYGEHRARVACALANRCQVLSDQYDEWFWRKDYFITEEKRDV